MYCIQCGHFTEEAQFCIKCGTKLITESETATTQATTVSTHTSTDTAHTTTSSEHGIRSAESSVYIKKAKTIGLMYGQYVRKLFKKPALFSETIDKSNVMNGLISLILFAITIPFIFYIQLKKLTSGLFFIELSKPSFFNVVIKSIFFLAVLLCIITLAIFLYTRLCKLKVSYRDVVARFGAFLTIPAALQLAGLITAIIQLSSVSMYLLSFGMLGLLVAICLTVYSYRRDQEQGIDALYGIILTFLIMWLWFRIAGGEIISSLISSFMGPFGF